jgi:hypothetical protein
VLSETSAQINQFIGEMLHPPVRCRELLRCPLIIDNIWIDDVHDVDISSIKPGSAPGQRSPNDHAHWD